MNYRITTYSDELYHYGVLGMHWGVRRYQDYKGRRIGAGEPAETRVTPGMKSGRSIKTTIVGGQGGKATGTARLAAKASSSSKDIDDSASSDDKKPGIFDRTIRNGKGKENTSPAEEMAKGVRNVSRDSKPIVDIVEKHDPKIKEARDNYTNEAKKMSDKELRDQINRIKMEREYADLKSSEVDNGYDKAREILEVAGDLASIAVSIATFIAIVHKLRHVSHDDVLLDDDTLAFIEDFENVLAQDGLTLEDIDDDFLEHHGVKGMRWGVRRYQNYDGTRIGAGSGAGGGKGGGGSKASSPFHNTVVGGQGGKATGTARLAAKAPNPVKSIKKYSNTVTGGQGGKATGTARLAAKAQNPLKDLGEKYSNTVVGGQGGKATGTARLAASSDPRMSLREKVARKHANAVQKDIDSLNNTKNIPHVSEQERKEIIKALEKVRDKSLSKADKMITIGEKYYLNNDVLAVTWQDGKRTLRRG